MKKILLVLVAILSLFALTSCASSNDCVFCEHHGYTRCASCENAEQYSPGIIKCAICDGRGHSDGIDCMFCGAKGYNICTPCQGSGRIDCPFCNRHS